MMKYPWKILNLTLLASFACSVAVDVSIDNEDSVVQTITYKDSNGIELEELAFRAPMEGLPEQALKIYCANVKVRLYWGVFREEVKPTARRRTMLRRVARFTKQIFDEVRDIDRPFNATMLTYFDEYFAIELPKEDSENSAKDQGRNLLAISMRKVKKLRNKLRDSSYKRSKKKVEDDGQEEKGGEQLTSVTPDHDVDGQTKRSKSLDHDDDMDNDSVAEQLDSSSSSSLTSPDISEDKIKKIKYYYKKYGPKILLGIYTRVRTMWWLMMPCLFTKYYLWDPALDDFIKLKRTLVMYPKFQLFKLQDLDCKSTKFFKRILDVCKILNPLMNMSFGELSLDKMTKFKSDLEKF